MSYGGFSSHILAKIVGNTGRLLLSLIIITIVPRALGPTTYGAFEFLRSFFSKLISFLEMGSSSAFYVFYSRNNRDTGILRFYRLVLLGVLILVLSTVGLGIALGYATILWPDIPLDYLLLGSILGFFFWLRAIGQRLMDALGLTIAAEKLALLVRALSVCLIIVMFISGMLGIHSFYMIEIFTLIALLLVWWSLRGRFERTRQVKDQEAPDSHLRDLFQEFYSYCKPLFWLSLVSFLATLADLWLLRTFAGAEDQGLFFLAFRVSAVCLLFSTAITQLITREFSRAFGMKDRSTMRALFERYSPLVFLMTAYISVFVSVQADRVVILVGGASFSAAAPAMIIMALFPIYQIYGQMNAALYKATDRTHSFGKLSIAGNLAGIILVLLLLLPQDKAGLELGSFGLALKMILIQFLLVNAYLWVNLRYLELPKTRFMITPLLVVTILYLLGLIVSHWAQSFNLSDLSIFLASGFAYTVLVMGLAFLTPGLLGIRREDITTLNLRLRSIFTST